MTTLKTIDGLEFHINGDGPYSWQLWHDGLLLEVGTARFQFTLAWQMAKAERQAQRRRARRTA